MTQPSRRILLVEDSDDLRESLALLLELEGHQVRSAGNGQTALEMARQEPPEFALVDLGLPDMDGCELASRMRELPELSNVRLVALTGFAGAEVEQRCHASGFSAHLVKPVEIETLQRLLA